MSRFEKAAYGGEDEHGEYDRWYDGGPAFGLGKQKMIDMTRLFAAEAARRKAQLQFHSDRYGDDMFSPEEAVKRIGAVNRPERIDDEEAPNYYSLQYPLKPRSGILETLRLKSPGPIDDWGPEGHPMEAVNKALMGMRSSSGSLKKAAAFGAMMGKRAADPRILNAPYSKSPNSDGVTQAANSPAQDARMRSSHADAEAELFGLRAPLGFSRDMYKYREGYARNKDPKASVNRDGGMRMHSVVNTPASPWRSGYTSPKVEDIQNAKHYKEMANMNRANPPKNINGVPAARARLSDQQDSNAAQVLPYLAGKKFK